MSSKNETNSESDQQQTNVELNLVIQRLKREVEHLGTLREVRPGLFGSVEGHDKNLGPRGLMYYDDDNDLRALDKDYPGYDLLWNEVAAQINDGGYLVQRTVLQDIEAERVKNSDLMQNWSTMNDASVSAAEYISEQMNVRSSDDTLSAEDRDELQGLALEVTDRLEVGSTTLGAARGAVSDVGDFLNREYQYRLQQMELLAFRHRIVSEALMEYVRFGYVQSWSAMCGSPQPSFDRHAMLLSTDREYFCQCVSELAAGGLTQEQAYAKLADDAFHGPYYATFESFKSALSQAKKKKRRMK